MLHLVCAESAEERSKGALTLSRLRFPDAVVRSFKVVEVNLTQCEDGGCLFCAEAADSELWNVACFVLEYCVKCLLTNLLSRPLQTIPVDIAGHLSGMARVLLLFHICT
ncbi:hypothetical protein L7F22_061802 [Adiantum nelumboides]|nr:hypothetical protein [Adiantum nelumboides]